MTKCMPGFGKGLTLKEHGTKVSKTKHNCVKNPFESCKQSSVLQRYNSLLLIGQLYFYVTYSFSVSLTLSNLLKYQKHFYL